MNVTELTAAAGWIAGLAIVALIASGWRKPARAATNPTRARSVGQHVPVVEQKAPLAEPTPLWKKGWSVVASGGLAIWVAAVLATVIAFGAAWVVITLTDMLKQ